MLDKEALIEEAETILEKHSLSHEDRVLWQRQLAVLSPEATLFFIDTFDNDAELLTLTTINMKKKIEADDDPQKIQKLIEEEKNELLRLLKT